MTQGQRDSVMLRFRSGRARLLVATNVAARGLDISHVSHVISYDVPDDPEEYTHRIGRTGRVDRTGVAYTFVGPKDRGKLEEIEKVTGATIERIGIDRIATWPEAAPADSPAVAPIASAPIAAAVPAPVQAPAPVAAPAPAGEEPGGPSTRLFVGAGRRHGASREDIAGLVTPTGVEPLRIKVHHAFSFVDVPTEDVDRVIAALAEARLGNRKVSVELAQRQPDADAAAV
jgi:ATP-dependent RNA helicase DeaD